MNGSILFPQERRRHMNEIFLRMSVCSASAPDWHLQSGLHCINSLVLCCKGSASLCCRNTWTGHTLQADRGCRGYRFYPQLRYDQEVLASQEVLPCCTQGGQAGLMGETDEKRHAVWPGDIEYHRPVGITRLSTSKLRDLTHLDAQVAPALQSLTDQGSRSRPSSQALLQKRSLCWSIGAIKLC